MNRKKQKEYKLYALTKTYADIEVLFDNYENFLIFLFTIKKYFKNELSQPDKILLENLLNNLFQILDNMEINYENDKNNILSNNAYSVSVRGIDRKPNINWQEVRNMNRRRINRSGGM